MKEFLNYLEQYNQEIEPLTEEFFGEAKEHVLRYDPVAGQLIDDYRALTMEGKKIRGCLILLGYQLFGGKDRGKALRASLAMEIIQTALLIHDDVMDKDDLRRGLPTIHKRYSGKFGAHYGQSMALVIGDTGFFMAFTHLTACDFPSDTITRVTNYLSRRLTEVGFGQSLDLTYEKLKRFGEDEVIRIHTLKTAEYTISGPLALGAILAGANPEQVGLIEKFGIPVGVAFQLRDDELGIYSTEEELGKPIGSDIRGGKVTLLISKALELAPTEDRRFLESVYGSSKITEEEIERVKDIIKKCGALEYSQNLSRKLVKEGKQFIPQITDDPYFQQLLSELADLGIERTS